MRYNDDRDEVRATVREYYGQTLASSKDLKTNACCVGGAPPEWMRDALASVHPSVSERFYGCGYPIPLAVEGARVLDLGCGTGRDVFALAKLVGPKGAVIGLDMTDEQLAVARETERWHADRFGYEAPNTRFVQGFIEDLASVGIADRSQDIVVSNCVVNLSPRKDLVLAEAARVLAPGGEFYVSDVFADRRLAADVVRDPILYAECLGGAMYEHDFVQLARRSGFGDPRLVHASSIEVTDRAITAKAGAARFRSATYRLFKLDGLDDRCEDYGQVARYRGGIAGAEAVLWLDDHHAFERDRPERVCGNTAAMLRETRFGRYFEVTGDRETHFGEFSCGPTMAAQSYATNAASRCC